MNWKALVLAVLGTLAANQAWAFSGNDMIKWMKDYEDDDIANWNGGMFLGYVSGVADLGGGILFCPGTTVTNGQNAAIVAKWLKNNPEKWGREASTLVIEALQRGYPACKKS